MPAHVVADFRFPPTRVVTLRADAARNPRLATSSKSRANRTT